MRNLCSLAIVFISSISPVRADEKDDYLDLWKKTAAGTKSLVVEFKFERAEPLRHKTTVGTGRVRLLKSESGTVLASAKIRDDKSEASLLNALMIGSDVYELDEGAKSAVRYAVAPADVVPFLARHFIPFVAVLNAKHVGTDYRLKLAKQDEWYTYFNLELRRPWPFGTFGHSFDVAKMAVLQKDAEGMAKGTPRKVVISASSGQEGFTYEVMSWQLNGKDKPAEAEFLRPDDREGWTVKEAWKRPGDGSKSPLGEMSKY